MGGYSAVLIIGLISAGYVFSTRCYFLRYQVARQAGHRLYLTAITTGVFFLVPALLVGTIISPLLEVVSREPYLWVSYDHYPIYLSLFALIAAFIAASLYNNLVPYSKSKNLWRVWKRNDFEFIAAIAQAKFKPVAVTLDCRKVYVGILISSLEPGHSDEDRYIRLLPFYSGYRHKDTFKMNLTSHYDMVIEKFQSEKLNEDMVNDYCVVVPKSQIVSFHIYNHHLYQKFGGKESASQES